MARYKRIIRDSSRRIDIRTMAINKLCVPEE